jgi:hypothetical protein
LHKKSSRLQGFSTIDARLARNPHECEDFSLQRHSALKILTIMRNDKYAADGRAAAGHGVHHRSVGCHLCSSSIGLVAASM